MRLGTRVRIGSRVQQARESEKAGRWDEAAQAYEAALEQGGDSAPLRFRLGFVRERQGELDLAAAAYEAALANDPRLGKAHFRLGFVRERQDRPDLAETAYEAALLCDDSAAEWHFRLGYARERLKRFHAAVQAYEAALSRDGRHLKAIERLPRAREGVVSAQWEEALSNLDFAALDGVTPEQASSLPPLALEKYCRLLFLKGERRQAQALVSRAPFSPKLKMLEASIHHYLGQLDEAERCYSLVAEDKVAKVSTLAQVAHIRWLRGDRDGAMELLHALVSQNPNSLRPITLFGRFAEREEEVQRLLADLRMTSKERLPLRNYAQLARTCMKPEAVETARYLAEAAAIRASIDAGESSSKPVASNEHTGLPVGAFTSSRGNIALQELGQFGRQHGIRFFPMGGTLLGHVRDGRLIHWDKDLDLGCFSDEATCEDIRRLLGEHPSFLVESAFEDEHGLIKVKHFSGTPVDIFINVKDGKQITHSGQIVTWVNEKFDLVPAEVQGAALFLPADPEKYLVEHYGPDWRKPDAHFDVFHEAPNILESNRNRLSIYAIAKAIDLIATGALGALELRLERARGPQAPSEVSEGMELVLGFFNRYLGGKRA